ncbi:MAG: polysaccharide biosynthesis tyrosine autokinase [Geodermatophilaceae bacterium]|nr:polysaccharide biosynthesis tyrosine autokinase [Geodermatophilaceae bacterium]
MDLRQYLHALRVHWRAVWVCLLLGVAVGGALTLTTTPVYAATSSVFISTSGSSPTETANVQADTIAANRVPTYAKLLTGRNLAQRVINTTGVDMTPAELAGSISTEFIADISILDATVTDESPVRAQLLANAVAGEFVILVKEIETPAESTLTTETGEQITTTPTAPVKASRVETATLPGAPVAPSTTNNLALGAALGLLLGILIALLRHLLDNTVKTGKQVEEVTNAAVLGGVLFDPSIPEHPLTTDYSANSRTGESYRQIRTSLQFVSVDDPPRVMVVTSSVSGEGKSTTAINLALVLAHSGNRVVLVEADLRRPRVTRYMRLVSGVGLTNVLVGNAELSEVLQPWRDGKLTVLAAGPHPPNPSELLGSAQMGHVLAELREKNDYVIIDAPPLLPVTDAAVLSVLADGAVIVTRYGSTKREILRTAAESLQAIDARLIGTVLNMVVLKGAQAYGYGYGYGYGYEAESNAPRDLDPRVAKGRKRGSRSRGRTTADTGSGGWKATADTAADAKGGLPATVESTSTSPKLTKDESVAADSSPSRPGSEDATAGASRSGRSASADT